mmetsp:Transcript_11757/g.42963  ORF Transcript_11757/g.42963 Transcript_11757/m.42963 type:complete len:94 (+) Transcript_11757:3-284(+)
MLLAFAARTAITCCTVLPHLRDLLLPRKASTGAVAVAASNGVNGHKQANAVAKPLAAKSAVTAWAVYFASVLCVQNAWWTWRVIDGIVKFLTG